MLPWRPHGLSGLVPLVPCGVHLPLPPMGDALEALMQSRHPVRVDPFGGDCWRGNCARQGEEPLGLCATHLDQLRDPEREEEP